MKLTLFIGALLISCICFGQNNAIEKAEKELVSLYKSSCDNHPPDTYFLCRDSILNILKQKLAQVLLMPGSEKYRFPGFKEFKIGIISSPDKKIRFFNWDDGLGGSQASFATVAQYIDDKGELHSWISNYGFSRSSYIYFIDSIIPIGSAGYLLFQRVADGINGGYSIGNIQITKSGISIENEIFEKNSGDFESYIILSPAYDEEGHTLTKYKYDSGKKELFYTIGGLNVWLNYDGKYFRKNRDK